MANPVCKPTMVFVGGRGTKAGNANATGCTVASFTGDLSDYMGTNGDLLVDNATALATQSDTTLYPSGKVKLEFTGTGARVGMLIRCTGGTYYAGIYEILEVGVGNSFVIIDVTYRGDDTVYVYMGGAFQGIQQALDDDISLREAADTKYYNRYICTNKDETLSSTIAIPAESSEAYLMDDNAWLIMIGFKYSLYIVGQDVFSDCDRGYTYYQGCWSSFRRNHSWTDHNPNGHLVHWDFNDNTVECNTYSASCIEYRNIKAGNNSGTYYFMTALASIANIYFHNCWIYDVHEMSFRSLPYYIGENVFQDCYISGWRTTSSNWHGRNNSNSTINCIVDIGNIYATFLLSLNTLFYNVSRLRTWTGVKHFNCIYVSQASCIEEINSTYYHYHVNCIFCPTSASAQAITGNTTTNPSPKNRYMFRNNIAWSLGSSSALTYIDSKMGTTQVPVELVCIEQDPKFVNPADGDFRLQPDSPALNAGIKDLFGGFTSIGPYDMRASNLSKGHK